MRKRNSADELAQQWASAIEEARENESRTRQQQALDNQALDSAAGLNVKTRVRAGLYPTQDILSTNCCTGHNCL